MSNDAIKTSQLGIVTTLSANDRVVVLTNPATAAQTQTVSVSNLARVLASNAMPVANSSQLGVIKIGPGLSVAANGVVSAPIPVANATTAGVIKVGNNLSVDETGALNATGGSGNTGNITFTNTIISQNSGENIYINNPNNAIQIGAQWIAQMSATSQANSLWGNGNTESYSWVYQEPDNESYSGYSEAGVYVQKPREVGNSAIIWAQYILNPNNVMRFWGYDPALGGSTNIPLTIQINDTQHFTFSNAPYYSPATSISSPEPLVLRSNNYVTTVINDSNTGFAELWWHNRDYDAGPVADGTSVDVDFYLQSDGATLVTGKYINSSSYDTYTWHWGMDGKLDIPSGGDIRRDGVSVIGTGQIDGGNAFTTPTAEITVDGGGA